MKAAEAAVALLEEPLHLVQAVRGGDENVAAHGAKCGHDPPLWTDGDELSDGETELGPNPSKELLLSTSP